ncbi:hypothetical protein [Hafnia alvei]|uniref:Uncharacterized protein n=1 Tax=Hafnia alvei TaxID=569 RepID=A0A1C6Z5H6_HAFAL|nr:hypothetical protein BN1044_03956 [Hafnia alvei]
MATILTQAYSSESFPFTLSFNAQTDFTALADYCERFANGMLFSG